MKAKLWIKTRVFLSFSIFTIIIINLFSYLLYYSWVNNFLDNTYKTINNEFETIKTFIDLQKSNIFSLPEYEIEKINSLWFFFYIWNNEKESEEYKLGFNNIDNKKIVFRWDYKWYNIIIWKNIEDIYKLKDIFIEMTLLLNIFIIISCLFLSYLITTRTLKPLSNLSNFLTNFDIKNSDKLLINKYWNSEIWKLTKSLNTFILEIKNIFNSQKDFIQDVSHELKTPLMQIESNIELIEDKITDEKIKTKLENIKLSLKNINEIISNLWFILRWEETILKKEKININDYLEKLIKNYLEDAKKKNIKIIIEKNFDLILENNVYYLDRLFWNLISNAIYYNNWNNDIKIIIEENKIEIIDNWIWIEKEEIQKIFNRFYRNRNSSLYYKEWSWLWLVIVKKICDIFAWKLEIKSEVWVWSSFVILV